MQKENNNYRTPTIEEFVEGFEYEECNNGNWYPRKTVKIKEQNPCDIIQFQSLFKYVQKDFRVKINNNE